MSVTYTVTAHDPANIQLEPTRLTVCAMRPPVPRGSVGGVRAGQIDHQHALDALYDQIGQAVRSDAPSGFSGSRPRSWAVLGDARHHGHVAGAGADEPIVSVSIGLNHLVADDSAEGRVARPESRGGRGAPFRAVRSTSLSQR